MKWDKFLQFNLYKLISKRFNEGGLVQGFVLSYPVDVLVGNFALKRNIRLDDYLQNVDMESGDEESDHLEEYHESLDERDLKDRIPKVYLPRSHPAPHVLQACDRSNSFNLFSSNNL